MSKQLSVIFKFPTRGRVDHFFKSLDSIYNNLSDMENYSISLTLDSDDETMTHPAVYDQLSLRPNLSIAWGTSKSKIHAVNRDMPKEGDIIIVMSDDMLFTFYGFDQIIRQEFANGDLDKLIHIPDSDAKEALATMYIAGRVYYDRLGYVYHPSYLSVWADNEAQEVAKQLGKYHFVNCPGIIFHANAAYGHRDRDEMFNRQQDQWDTDFGNYNERKSRNFDL